VTRAEAHSEVTGNTQISMFIDPKSKRLYLDFNVETMHKRSCLWFGFPSPAYFPKREALIRKRMAQVSAWHGNGPLKVNWTKSTTLELRYETDQSFSGISLKHGNVVVKSFEVLADVEQASEPPDRHIFAPPGPDCRDARDVAENDLVATVLLRPPHQRSSVLNDLLLVLQTKGLPEDFIALSAMSLPGDTAIFVEDPAPPRFDTYAGISFTYSAEVFRQKRAHKSNGSMWLDLKERSFHIYGKATHTVLGGLDLDFLAVQKPKPLVYANVLLETQSQRQCLFYDYPAMPQDGIKMLGNAPQSKLRFHMVDEIDNEDCAVFVADLPRGRLLYMWVVMELDNPHSVLRTEIRHNEKTLRKAEIFDWRRDSVSSEQLQPEDAWRCTAHGATRHDVAEMDMSIHKESSVNARDIHKRSLGLLDTLYAMQSLSLDFAMVELLALPGDVAIVVSEPELPELWTLPSLAFNYSLSMDYISASVGMGGYFAADLQQSLFRMTVGALGVSKLDVVVGHGEINVQIRPVMDIQQCPDLGIRQIDRCWYLSKKNENCRDTCAKHGLAFDWAFVGDGEPIMPQLLGHQPSKKQKPWGRIECFVRDEDRYHPAQPKPEADTEDEGDPGDWKYYSCELACSCSPLMHTDQTHCLSVGIPDFNSTTSFFDGTLSSFEKVGAVDNNECNVFSFPARTNSAQTSKMSAELLESAVDLWYSEEDSATHRIELRGSKKKTFADIEVSAWHAPANIPNANVLEKPADWQCTRVEEKFEPWLELAESKEVARLVWKECGELNCPVPASAALWELAEAVGVVSIIPPSAQDKLSRLIAWPAARPPHRPHAPLKDLFSTDLEAFSFSFVSVFPSGLKMGQSHGVGEIKVDLKGRRLFMQSEATNVSAGIQSVISHVIYLDDARNEELAQPLLLLQTEIGISYQQCWSVKGEKKTKHVGPRVNPFTRARPIGGGPFSAPTTHHGQHFVARAKKYHLTLSAFKNAELFVDEQGRLIGLRLIDTQHSTTASVVIRDWNTDPIDDKAFEVSDDWNCDDARYPDFGSSSQEKKLADWDLLSFFFPEEELEDDSPPLTISSSGISRSSTPAPHRILEGESSENLVSV
jgi:hypothetical protein